MTPTEQKQEAARALEVLAEEIAAPVQDAVAHERHGTLHVSLHYQGGRLNHAKTSFEKIRQVEKR